MSLYPCKRHYNRSNLVVSLGDSQYAREHRQESTKFYCARPSCGPMFGEQCEDCRGYDNNHVPPFRCFNRKGYEMILGPQDGMYYCGKSYSGVTKLFGMNGGRCHPSKHWQCKHCQGFSSGASEPPLRGRKDVAVPELCEANPFKSKKSSNTDI